MQYSTACALLANLLIFICSSIHLTITCIYDGSQCGSFSLCIESCPVPPPEICDNSQDDDCDGQQDCLDTDCLSHPFCLTGDDNITYSYMTNTIITIDGNLSEDAWNHAHMVTFSNPSRSDNIVRVRTLWDDTNVYLAYDVTDQNLEAQDQDYWRDDGAEIFIDTNDNHFIVNIHDLTDQTGIQSSTLTNQDGYIMEISIPWSAISQLPSVGLVMKLLLGNNDMDDGVSSQFDWTGLIESGHYFRPDLWGDILLTHRADKPPCNGRVDTQELVDFIDLWKYDSTAYPMGEMMEAVVLYYSP